MKKILLFIIIIVLILSLTSCSVNEIVVHNVDVKYLNTECCEYFFNLRKNYVQNVQSSCAYQSFSMLLGYYDVYYNDNIVDEKYIVNGYAENNKLISSPGCIHEDINSSDYQNPVKYYEYVEETKEYNLQSFLISMLAEKYNLYNKNLEGRACVIKSANSRIEGYNNELELLFSEYFYTYKGFTEEEICLKRIYTREALINLLKKGIPVLSRAYNSYDSGHYQIIYDYDEKEDNLYSHMGWYLDSYHADLKESFKKIDQLYYIEINLNHSCNKCICNSNEDNKLICSCELRK